MSRIPVASLAAVLLLSTVVLASSSVRHQSSRRRISTEHRRLITKIALDTVDKYFQQVVPERHGDGEEEVNAAENRLGEVLRDRIKASLARTEGEGEEVIRLGPDLVGAAEEIIDYLAQALEEVADYVLQVKTLTQSM